MSLPILTVSFPIGDRMSRISRSEFLASQRERLEQEFNYSSKNYHILVFENYLDAPIIEIHNSPDDSVDTIERFRQRIQTIIDLMKPPEILMDIEQFKESQQ